MHAGAALKKVEDEKGIVIRFVIGRRSILTSQIQRKECLECFIWFSLYPAAQSMETVWIGTLPVKIGRPMTSLFLYV